MATTTTSGRTIEIVHEPASRDAPPTMPSRRAFLLSFLSVITAGVFGGVIGYGLVDISCERDCSGEALLGAIVGALIGAVGVGIVAALVLRAMSEWRRVPPNRPNRRS